MSHYDTGQCQTESFDYSNITIDSCGSRIHPNCITARFSLLTLKRQLFFFCITVILLLANFYIAFFASSGSRRGCMSVVGLL